MTDIKQLEKAIHRLQDHITYCTPITEITHDSTFLETVLKAARAHLEALKQEPFIYLSRRGDDGSIHSIGHEVVDQSNIVCTPLYSAPVPQEKPVVKLPNKMLMVFSDYGKSWNECREKIKELNPHITFEVKE